MLGIVRNPMPLPKVISPRKHALLDALTIGTFLALGGIWWRRKRRPAVAALVNGLFVLGYTSLTDFDGDGKKQVNFKTHGDLDALQASLAAVTPKMFGFAGRKEALFFRGQALNESLVISMTDFEANEPKGWRQRWNRAA